MEAVTETAWIHRAASFRWQLMEELCRAAGYKTCVQEGTAEGCSHRGRSSDMYRCGLGPVVDVPCAHLPWHPLDAQTAAQDVLVSHSREEGAAGASLIRAQGVCGNSLLLTLTADFKLLALPIISQQTPRHGSESPCVLWLLPGCLQSQQVQ